MTTSEVFVESLSQTGLVAFGFICGVVYVFMFRGEK